MTARLTWNPTRLKYLGNFKGGAGFPHEEQGVTEAELPFFKVKNLAAQGDSIEISDSYISRLTAKNLGAFIFPKNTIVFAKVGAALLLQRFKFLAQASCIDNNMMGLVVNESKAAQPFLKYFFESLDFSEIVNPGAVPSLNEEQISGIALSIPPVEKQIAIAASLDRQIFRIDALVSAKQHLLTLLAEKRSSLISRAITKGLNPYATYSDSGIPWLGEIPAHWKSERAKWLFTERDDRSESGDEELLSVSHLTGVTSRAEKNVNMFMAESLEGYKRCEVGDLVINTLWAWMGAMGVARQPGIVSPAYNVYQPVPELDAEYIDLLVRTPRFAEEITRYSKGVWSSRMRLYPEGFYEAWLPVPPMQEQQAIAAHVKQEVKKIDEFAQATERTITLLQERRSALISATETGQLEV